MNAVALSLSLFMTANLPHQLYPMIWVGSQRNAGMTTTDSVQLASALASGVLLPLLAPYHDNRDYNGVSPHPSEACAPLSRWWLYTWVSPVVSQACADPGSVRPKDLLPIKTENLPDTWLQVYLDCHHRYSSFKATMWVLFRSKLASMAFFAACCGMFEFVGTVGLYQILLALQNSKDTKLQLWFSITLFTLCPIIRGVCMQTFEYLATHTIGAWKSMIISAVYQKLLAIEDENSAVGQLQSFISADIDRLGTLRYTVMTVFMVPVELIVSSILLYRIMGWYYLPSFVFLLITRHPLSRFIVSAQSGVQSDILQSTDDRITKTSETLRAMITI